MFDFSGKKVPFSDIANEMTDHFEDIDFDTVSPEEPAIVAPLWAVGDFINFSGPSGIGKSFIAADVVLAGSHPGRNGLALGGLLKFDLRMLGHGKIAYLDAENTITRFGAILKRKMDLEGLDPRELSRKILYISAHNIGLSNPSTWEERSDALAQALAWNQVRFVIGDTLGRLWSPREINSTEWVQRGYARFRMACKQYGISGLMLTHTKRPSSHDPSPGQPLGTSYQESQADGQILIQRTKKPLPAGLKLTFHKGRRSYWIQQGSTVSVRFTPKLNYEIIESGVTPWPHECPEDLPSIAEIKPDTQQLVYQTVVDASPEFKTTNQIAEQLKLSERTIRNYCGVLSRAGRIKRFGNGRNTRWRLA